MSEKAKRLNKVLVFTTPIVFVVGYLTGIHYITNDPQVLMLALSIIPIYVLITVYMATK